MNKKCGKNFMNYYQCTNRIIIIKMNSHPTITTIIQVYTSTTTYNNDNIEVWQNRWNPKYNKKWRKRH